jgi:PAS domain-containing protein
MEKFMIHDLDLQSFVKELSNCTGQVWMTTEEGDKINLQSAFCRIVGVMSVLEGGKLSSATIECEKPEDESRLFRLNLYGKSERSED